MSMKFPLHESKVKILDYQECFDRYGVASFSCTSEKEKTYKDYTSWKPIDRKIVYPVENVKLNILKLENVFYLRGLGVLCDDGFIHHQYSGWMYDQLLKKHQQLTSSFAEIKEDYLRDLQQSELQTVNEDSFLLASAQGGAFGHFSLEALPKLWALEHLGKKLKVFCAGFEELSGNALRAFGVFPEQTIVSRAKIVYFKTLYVPAQAITPYLYCTKTGMGVMKKIGRYISDKYKNTRINVRKVYLKRDEGGLHHRIGADEDFLEKIFVKRGFTVVLNENLDAASQLLLYTQVDALAGAFGSSFFNAFFSQQFTHILSFISESHFRGLFGHFDDSYSIALYKTRRTVDLPHGNPRYRWDIPEKKHCLQQANLWIDAVEDDL